MKTTLVFPPTANPSPSYFGPAYAISLLAAVLHRAGQVVTAHDYDRVGIDAALADVERVVREEHPDLVGLSCLSGNRGATIRIARRFKELAPDTPVLLGGPFPTVEPELMLRACGADFVCIGDGEETLLELLAALERGGGPEGIAGLAWRDGEAVRRNPLRPRFVELDSLPYPKLDLFPVRELLAAHRHPAQVETVGRLTLAGRRPFVTDSMIMLVTSRGCPWKCTFCPMSLLDGRSYRHSPAYVAGLVEHVVETYGHKKLAFGDNNLTMPREDILALCDLLIERRLDVEWSGMTRADLVDAEVLDRMAAAGCKELSYGVESLSPTVQRTIGKRLDVERVGPALELTHQAGISSCMMMMVGNPGDTRATLRQTIDRARGLQPDRILIYTTRVYPGTRLWDVAREQGVATPDLSAPEEHPAPLYTGESGPRELGELEGMLQHRTTYVALEHGCAVGCCERRSPRAEPDGDSLEGKLALAGWRAEHTVLGGGEPFLRSDLPEILARATASHTRDLRLYTSGGPLAGPVARALRSEKSAVRLAIVPIHSMAAADHDRRVRLPGALRDTRKGLLAWTRRGGGVIAWAFLDRKNVRSARTWIRWLAEHGAREVLFVFHRSPPGWGEVPVDELPTLEEAGAAVAQAAEEGRSAGVEVSVTGLPECVLPRAARSSLLHELGRPFDELLDGPDAPRPCARERGRRKSWASACERCALRPGCEGVWAAYLKARGDGELLPVAQPTARARAPLAAAVSSK